MSTLKPLEFKTLKGANRTNYKLDALVVGHTLTPTITDAEFIQKFGKDFGLDTRGLAGRRTSLVVRGHLPKKGTTTKKKTTKKTKKIVNTVAPNPDNKRKWVLDLNAIGFSIREIASIVDSPKSTVYRWVSDFKKDTADTNNTYHNENGENKEIARNKMAKYIVDADIDGTVLSLPFSTCAIEKKILVDQPSAKFLGVEIDKPTYNELRQTVRRENLPMETYRGSVSDKIYGCHEDTYSHMILDYCGMLPTFSKEIEYAVKNKVVKSGGIMALTFAKPIRGKSFNAKFIMSLGLTITNNPNDTRCQSDKATEAYFNRLVGDDFDFVEIFNYTDTYPMTLIILKRK